MAFYQSDAPFDLGELNIENLFVLDFMPSASGTYVKVYLMGLMISRSETDADRLDNRSLATILGIPLQDVLDAWQYWEKQGIVKRHITDNPQQFDIEFYSLRALYIQNNYTSKIDKAPRKKTEKRQTHYKKLYDAIERIVGHPLSYAEYRDVGDFYDHYYADEAILSKAFEITYKERNIRQTKAVKSILVKWQDLNLKTLAEIEQYIDETEARYGIYKDVLKTLGIPYRLANEAEKETIDKWLDVYGFTLETILKLIKAYAMKTNSLNFNFLDNRFKHLLDNGINTYEAFVNFDTREKEKPKSTSKRNQHIIEKERTYSEEELENLLLNKRDT